MNMINIYKSGRSYDYEHSHQTCLVSDIECNYSL